MDRQRILIIGIDGFSWRIGNKLIHENHAPVLKQLVQNGCYGILKSVIPFETSPAWVSFQTGCFPPKTGIFAFHGFLRQTSCIKLNNYQDIKVPTLWELLNEAGKKFVSINMPVTSPPPHLNGIVIPGLTCPKLSRDTVYPPDLFDKYIRPRPDYLIVNNEPQPTLSDGVAQASKTEEIRCRLALELMREVEWDVFFVQIQSTDVFQHRYWWAIDPNAEGFTDEAYTEAMKFYESIDDILGRLIEAAGPTVLKMMVSDHGFCPKKSQIGINTWLWQNHYLYFKNNKDISPLLSLKDKIKNTIPLARQLAKAYGNAKTFFSEFQLERRGEKTVLYSEKVVKHIRETIDLDRTFAFCLGGVAGLLYIMDRSQKGKAADMLQQLLDAYGPASDDPLISEIQATESFCQTLDDNYPDYIIKFFPAVEGRINPEASSVTSSGVLEGKRTGTHEEDGVLIIQGENIKTNSELKAKIVDITPTLLACLGIPIPAHIDGRILSEIFEKEPRTAYSGGISKDSQPTYYSDREQSEVERRLADLGYL